MNRVDFDAYLMSLCLLTSQRSLDSQTKHGAIAVDQEHSILTTGYNSPPRGCNDQEIPLERPLKYAYFLHAEEALICNAARNGISLRGAKLYVTGKCCSSCVRKIINAGFSEIIEGPIGSNCVDMKDVEISRKMLEGQAIKVRKFNPVNDLFSVLSGTQNYLSEKLKNG